MKTHPPPFPTQDPVIKGIPWFYVMPSLQIRIVKDLKWSICIFPCTCGAIKVTVTTYSIKIAHSGNRQSNLQCDQQVMMPYPLSLATWSHMSIIRGEVTTANPGFMIQGNAYTTVFPPPVGITTITSSPLTIFEMPFHWPILNLDGVFKDTVRLPEDSWSQLSTPWSYQSVSIGNWEHLKEEKKVRE